MTFDEFKKQCDKLAADGLALAIEDAGSKAALARMVGRERESILDWKAVPLIHVKTICAALGRPPQRYRPDLFATPSLLRELAK